MLKPYLVIGGTGHIGREVIAQLAAARHPIRALVRDPEVARLPSAVETVQGDLTKPDSLDASLAGIETVFLVWTAPASAVEAALARIAGRARRIVFLTAPLKTTHPFFQQPNGARALAEKIEQTIEASELEWTYVRSGMFALNAKHFWGPQIRAGDVVRWPYLDAPTAPTDERDIAAVAVRALTEDGHARAEYVVTGPESLSQYEQITSIGSVLGRSLRIEEVSPDEARKESFKDFPAPVATMLFNAWSAAVGQPAFVTDTVRQVTGSPARTFREWVTSNAADFRQ